MLGTTLGLSAMLVSRQLIASRKNRSKNRLSNCISCDSLFFCFCYGRSKLYRHKYGQ